MSSEKTYKNKKIKIEKQNNEITLFIDDTKMEYDFDSDTKRYFAYEFLPYENFSSLEQLAKAIVDKQTKTGGN